MRLLEKYTILLLGLLFYLSSSFSKNTTQIGTNPVPPSQSIHFTPAWPHGDISEVFADVFFVTGTNKIHHEGVDIQTSRNMIILRKGSELTLGQLYKG